MPTLRSRKSIDYAAEAPKYRIVSKSAAAKAKLSKATKKASKAAGGSKAKKADAASDRAPLQALSANPEVMMAQGAIVMMGGAMAPPDSDSFDAAGSISSSKRSREDASTASSTSSSQKKTKQTSSSGPSRSKAKRAKSSATDTKAAEPAAVLTGGLSSLCNLSVAQANAPTSLALLTSPPRSGKGTDTSTGEIYSNFARDVTSDIAAILQAPTPAPVEPRAARTSAATAAAKAEAAGWRRRFESLRELRTTEAEARLEAAQKAAAQCQTAQAQLIAHQKEQIERLKAELKSAEKAAAKAAAPKARASGGGGGNGAAERECGRLRAELSAEQRNNEQLNDMLDTHRAVVGAYRTISGIGISLVQSTEAERASNSTRVQCTAINREKKLAAKYELLLPHDRDAQIEYTPGGNAHLLPEYMRDEIEFSWSDAPAMTRRVLSSIFG
eukprot:g2369.t1